MIGSITLVSNSPLAAPAGSWLGTIFLIYFYRSQKRLSAVFVVSAVYIAANMISFRGTIPILPLIRLGILAGYPALFCLLFFIDYLFYKCIPGFLKTLALPLGIVIPEYTLVHIRPYAASSAYAYTQYDDYPPAAAGISNWYVGVYLFSCTGFFSAASLFMEAKFPVSGYKKILPCLSCPRF